MSTTVAEDEGSYIGVFLHELAVQRIHVLSLLGTLRLLCTEDVVKEDGEGTYAERIHPLELLYRAVEVGLSPLDVATGMHSPYEVHLVLCSGLGQFADALCFSLGIGLTPLVTVVGVILGTVDVYVEFVLAIEVELAEAVLVAPGVTVKTLYHTALEHVGPVFHLGSGHLGAVGHLQEGLHTVVGTSLIVTGNHYLVLTYTEVVSFHLVGYKFFVSLHGFVATLADDDLETFCIFREIVTQKCYGIHIGTVGTFEHDGSGSFEGLATPHQFLRERGEGHRLLVRRCGTVLKCCCGGYERGSGHP